MNKNDLVYVGHMLDLAQAAVHKAAGSTHEQFDQDKNRRLALTHLIQSFGEAARHVSKEFRDNHRDVPWDKIVGMRHKVVHDYMHVDYDLVWDVATMELPPFLKQLENIAPP